MFHEIHLWCNTCIPLGSQHGSQAILFHILQSRHSFGSKLGSIMPLPHSVRPGRHSTDWTMPVWLSRNDFKNFCLSQHFLLNHTDLSSISSAFPKLQPFFPTFPFCIRGLISLIEKLLYQCFICNTADGGSLLA